LNQIRASVALIVLLAFSTSVSAAWHSDSQGIMGTEVRVTLWHEDPDKARLAIDAVMTEMRRIDALLSEYKDDSELMKVNKHAFSEPQTLSSEFALLIDKALYFSRISQGAFDITYASVGHFYDYRQGLKPSESQLQQGMKGINYRLLDFDKKHSTLSFGHKNIKINLGGIAKGYAVDRAIGILKNFGVEHASVSAGGDSRLLGDRRGREWVVGIKHPRQKIEGEEAVIRLPLSDLALSTSGDYERFFIDENSGERIHHIINPRTGKSAREVMSVTILGARGIDTDPLSTTVFVLGVQHGLELVNALPNIDAIIIDIRGKVHYSEGLAVPE
jgi:thiamine biosynthesis lipoprotein